MKIDVTGNMPSGQQVSMSLNWELAQREGSLDKDEHERTFPWPLGAMSKINLSLLGKRTKKLKHQALQAHLAFLTAYFALCS